MPAILTALLAAGQLAALPAPASRVCSTVDVVAEGQQKASRRRSFSATETLDLMLYTRLRSVERISGDQTLRLKLYTPRGYLYQTITVPFYSDPPEAETHGRGNEKKDKDEDKDRGKKSKMRVVPGFPRPLEVQQTRHARQGRQSFDVVSARLPVAGTSITLGSLYGRWTVVPFLNDDMAPCGMPRRFKIRE